MKSKVLMATLVLTLLMGARTYACDCGACDPACDPCAACNTKSCDLFSGLKKLVACSPCNVSDCGPCDGVVACSPCDEVACDPCGACGDLGCNDRCGKKFTFGKRLRNFFATRGCDPCSPCDTGCGPCDDLCSPCDADCGPCDDLCGPCDTGCGHSFSLKKFFRGFRLSGRCSDGCCDPCGACNTDCGPCDVDCGNGCGPCDDLGCNPCDGCNGCGPKFGRLFDKPRRNVKRFFDGMFAGNCNPCDPCGVGSCDPCEAACDPCSYSCPVGSSLPEAAN